MLAETDALRQDIAFFRFRQRVAEFLLHAPYYLEQEGRLNDVRESFLVFCHSSKLTSVVVCLIEVVLEILVGLSFCRFEALVFEQV